MTPILKSINRIFVISALLFLVSTTHAQRGFEGRWSTDPAPRQWFGWTATGDVNIPKDSAPAVNPKPAENSNRVLLGILLDLRVDGSKVTGFLGQDGVWGEAQKIEVATIDGKTIRFQTSRTLARPDGTKEALTIKWVAEEIDDNTISLRNLGGSSIVRINSTSAVFGSPPSSVARPDTLHRVN